MSDVPGPGAYDQTDGVAAKKAGIKFGKDPRDHAAVDGLPGPGAYDTKGGIAPNPSKYTFSKAARDKNAKNDTPFYYDIPPSIPDVARYNYPEVANRKIHL